MSTSGGRTLHLTLATGPPSAHRSLKNIALMLAGAAVSLAYAAYRRRAARRRRGPSGGTAPTPGDAALETRSAVDRLLQQHFGRPEDVLPGLFASNNEQKEALAFAYRLGVLAERHCPALTDFTGEFGDPSALDLGCDVGAVSFELARAFSRVVGVDTSTAAVAAAKTLRDRGWMRYTAPEEGDLAEEHSAVVPDDIERERTTFGVVADLAALPKNLAGPYDAVVAANMLCRVPNPAAVIAQISSLVRPGGVAVLATAFDWRESATPRANWLGGFRDQAGAEVRGEEALRTAMEVGGFELLATEELPWVNREHGRRWTLGLSQATVWRRK